MDVEPWASFVRAREAARTNPGEAIRNLRAILDVSGLESRHYLQAWNGLRELGIRPDETTAKAVLGVVVEVPVDGAGLDVLAAYADHSARYLNYSGAAVIWDRPDARGDAEIDSLLEAGRSIVVQIGPWDGPRPPVPPAGQHA